MCYGKAGLDCLLQLLNEPEVSADKILVVTYDDPTNSMLLDYIRKAEIKYTYFSKDKTCDDIMNGFKPDFLFSIYFRDIVKPDILSLVRYSSVNLHPSLLPNYRGCFSVPWCIINGEKETGISYHYMDNNIDTGPIILQEKTNIFESETAFSLYHRLVALGTRHFSSMFDLVVRKNMSGIIQQNKGSIYYRKVPFGGEISLGWGKERIYNFIRALYFPPYDGAKIIYNGKDYIFSSCEEFDRFCCAYKISLN